MLLEACFSIVFSLVSTIALTYVLESNGASIARPSLKYRDIYSKSFLRLGLLWKTIADIAQLRFCLSQAYL